MSRGATFWTLSSLPFLALEVVTQEVVAHTMMGRMVLRWQDVCVNWNQVTEFTIRCDVGFLDGVYINTVSF